jgi:hypothetical protein
MSQIETVSYSQIVWDSECGDQIRVHFILITDLMLVWQCSIIMAVHSGLP